MVAPVHVWDDVRVFQKECRTLAKVGFQVCLIARIRSPETVKGVRIIPPIGSSGNRLVRFLSLPIVGIQALMQNADIYHLHNPDTLPLVILLRLFGKTVIYDTHEDFAERILIRQWIPKWLRRPLAFLVSKSEAVLSTFTAASIATQQRVVDRLDDHTLLLGNPPRVNENLYARVNELAQAIDCQEGQLRAIYVGRIDQSRGLYDMVDALEIVNRTAPVRLWLIGPADNDDLHSARGRPGWKHVDYLPKTAQEQAFAYIERADVGLAVMRDVGGHAAIDSNKLYEYMMFGKPFIASAFDAWIDRLSSVDAGWYVRPGSADEIARTLLVVADNREEAVKKGARGNLFTQSYNWESESRKLLDLYGAL